MPNGTFPRSVGFITQIHLGKSPYDVGYFAAASGNGQINPNISNITSAGIVVRSVLTSFSFSLAFSSCQIVPVSSNKKNANRSFRQLQCTSIGVGIGRAGLAVFLVCDQILQYHPPTAARLAIASFPASSSVAFNCSLQQSPPAFITTKRMPIGYILPSRVKML